MTRPEEYRYSEVAKKVLSTTKAKTTKTTKKN